MPQRSHAQRIEQPRLYKTNMVWIKTSDGAIIELPQWQIDQMKALEQKNENSKDNPINTAIISSSDLALVSKAVNAARNLNEFKNFYQNLSEDEKGILVNSAANLGMQGLTSLLMTFIFPKEVQSQMGASAVQSAESIIAPVIKYLLVEKNKGQQIDLHAAFEDDSEIIGVEEVSCIALSSDGVHAVINIAGLGIEGRWLPSLYSKNQYCGIV